MNSLNPLVLPLNQNALIEASAGTGKTYTITTLYLRALLGLIDDEKVLTPKSIEQILVVTFTEAATQEIRDRVRKKLLEAQQVLLTDQLTGKPNQKVCKPNTETEFDSNLVELLNTYITRWMYCQAEPKQICTEAVVTEATIIQGNGSTTVNTQQAVLAAYHRLQNAITLIDEASIFTIHGFCHRCIKQFAFETNSSFEQRFEMDNKPVLQGALYDFWRKFVVQLTDAEFEWFERNWRNPEALYKDIASVIGKDIVLTPQLDTQRYNNLINDYQSLIVNLKQEWQKAGFSKLLAESALKKTSKIVKRIPVLTDFIQSDEWFPDFAKDDDWSLWGSDSLNNVSNYKAKSETISHPITQTIDKLAEVEHELKSGGFQSYWLRQAKDYIEQRAQQIKNEQQIINPDDLLTQLYDSINATKADETATQQENNLLLQAIRTKYPLAFIDEFQDTDPIQYGIFSAIYNSRTQDEVDGTQKDEAKANMILIGDPKQAIYKFRGADIFTYIQAKQDLPASQHYTLGTNWRSHPKLVNAVNQVFKKNVEGFRQKEIPFEAVSAGKSASTKLIDNGIDANQLTFCHLLPDINTPEKIGFKQPEAEGILAKWCASQIQQTILSAKQSNQDICSYIDDKGKTKPVQANDICVLVRNRNQASLIKKTLAQLNIRSVFISRDNIFNTALAKDLLRLLMAINSPYNEQKVRAACATCFFGYDVDTLFALQHDPVLWQQHLDWFYNANQAWTYGQISSAIESILVHANTLSTWQELEPTEYERLITDQRHLSELIQQQSVKHAGVEKLLHWYEQQVIADDNWSDATDDQQLRLESDSNLVQIATLHASKGLEYPIVYLPFVCEFKAAKSAIYNSKKETQDEETQGLTYRVDNRKQELQQAEGERLAEDLRLLYVAMTRPIFKLVIGVYNLLDRFNRTALEQSGLGQLLLGELATDQKPNNLLIQQTCEGLVALDGAITGTVTGTNTVQQNSFQYLPQAEDVVLTEFNQRKGEQAGPSLQGQSLKGSINTELVFNEFTGNVKDNWKMLSYSSLVAGAQQVEPQQPISSNTTLVSTTAITTAQEQLNDVWVAGLSDEQANEITDSNYNSAYNTELVTNTETEFVENRFSFPKGANAGTCLHWILENLDFQKPVTEQTEVIESGLTRYGIDLTWLDVTVQWMQQVIDCNLVAESNDKIPDQLENPPTVNKELSAWSLKDITQSNCLVEMEFYFNFKKLTSEVISNALQMMGLKGMHFGQFMQMQSSETGLSGIVKGFIDLTVQHKGKYYVLDYKSNYLGDDFRLYNRANLAVSMSDHHYEVQALIYTLALHRWLKTRLPDYDYNTHVGGALYLFLRGMQNSQGDNDHINEKQTGVYPMNIKQDVIEYLDAALNNVVTDSSAIDGTTINKSASNKPGSDSIDNPSSVVKTKDLSEDESEKKSTKTSTQAAPQMGFDFD